MIKREDLKAKEFLNEAAAEKLDSVGSVEDLHKYMRSTDWPFSKEPVSPSLAAGSSSLNKNMSIFLKEREWNSIDRHTKALKINKSTWIKYAIFKLMQEEQLYCFKSKRVE